MRILLKKQPGTEPVELIRDEAVMLEELAEEYRSELPYRVLIARVNGEDRELTEYVEDDAVVELLDMRNHSADLAYQHSLSLLYLKSVTDVLGDVGVEIENSLNKGLYTEIKTKEPITWEQVKSIEARMKEIVSQDLPIKKEIFTRRQAIAIWEKYNYPEKSKLLENAKNIGTFFTV